MEAILTNERIDKLLKPYWEETFEGSFVGEKYHPSGSFYKTCGIIKNDVCLVGLVIIANSNISDYNSWCLNKDLFKGIISALNLSHEEFCDSMCRYLKKNMNINIREIR